MYISINDVKPLDDYLLELTFENKEKKLFDMKPYLEKGVFKELKDKSLFNRVKVVFDFIEWPNGIDIDPEVLYEDSLPESQIN